MLVGRTTRPRTSSRPGSAAQARRRRGLLHALGLRDTIMYGGYETSGLRGSRGRSRSGSSSSRSSALGKYTTAWDLARLWRAVGRRPAGAARSRGVSRRASRPPTRATCCACSRSSRDRGKLDRFLGGGDVVLHKAGWLSTGGTTRARRLARGVFVATVMTFGGGGDLLAGRRRPRRVRPLPRQLTEVEAPADPGASVSRGSERLVVT